MKKGILILLAIIAMTVLGVSTGEAGVYGAGYLNGDVLAIYSASSWDGWNHFVINYNNQDDSASATVLDPNGIPSNAYGYNYFWADFYTDHFDFYGSNNGYNWVFLGSYY